MNMRLLEMLDSAAQQNTAIFLSSEDAHDWHLLCMAGMGVDIWSWREQDRYWQNNSEPLRIATKAGKAAIQSQQIDIVANLGEP